MLFAWSILVSLRPTLEGKPHYFVTLKDLPCNLIITIKIIISVTEKLKKKAELPVETLCTSVKLKKKCCFITKLILKMFWAWP